MQFKNHNFESEVWESDLTILKEIVVRVPIEIEGTMRELHRKFPHIEVGAYLKYAPRVEGEILILEVGKDIYIPRQECTAGDIKFLEPPPEGWSAVIHKHPTGVSSFSQTDETYINANFDLSILFEPVSGFCDASYRLKTDFGLLKMKPKIEVIRPTIDISKLPLENIQEKRYIPTYTKTRGYSEKGIPYSRYSGYSYTGYTDDYNIYGIDIETELKKRGFKQTGKFSFVKKEGKTKIKVELDIMGGGRVKIIKNGKTIEEHEFLEDFDLLTYIEGY